MYGRVAEFHSELVSFGLALYPGRGSLANESASRGSTPVAPLGSTPGTSTRSGMKWRVGIAGLLRFSESLCTRSSNWRSPLHQFAFGGDCPRDILGQDAQIALPSARALLSSLHAEFFTANSDQETR
jgi:hypothetical protein